ncbi:MAG: hypothetical protein WA005_04990 [Candidatus Binataceae bacterium]
MSNRFWKFVGAVRERPSQKRQYHIPAWVYLRPLLFLLLLLLGGPLASGPYGGSANASIVVNALGGNGAGISVGTSASVQILAANGNRLGYCVVCTVPVNAMWGLGSTVPSPEPSGTVGYPIATGVMFCESPRQWAQSDLTARMDVISTSGSGTCATREEQ